MSAKQISIAIAPKFSAIFSVFGSGFIIYDILCSHFDVSTDWWRQKKDSDETRLSGTSSEGFNTNSRPKRMARRTSSRRFAQRKTLANSAYYRLMLAMSCSDFIVSFAWFCTTWPIPKDENSIDNPSDSVYGNSGTMQTCTAQAFFIQLGIVTPFYNGILALYYYLTIRREWKEKDFRRRIEYAGHFIAVGFGLGTSIAGLVMEIFNNSKVWCWIAPYPSGCGDGPDQTPCLRGHNSKMLRWAFYYGPLWVMIFFVFFFMSLVYSYVRGLDDKMDKYTSTIIKNAARASSTDFGPSNVGGGRRQSFKQRTMSFISTDNLTEQRQQRRNERSRAVANQGLFYAGTFALVWVFGTIVRAMQLAGAKKIPWVIVFLFACFTPSQGFFNFLVYVRPRLIKHFERKKKKKDGKRSSKNLNSDIYHVSGFSNPGSSHEPGMDTSNKGDEDDFNEMFKPNSVKGLNHVQEESTEQYKAEIDSSSSSDDSEDDTPLNDTKLLNDTKSLNDRVPAVTFENSKESAE